MVGPGPAETILVETDKVYYMIISAGFKSAGNTNGG
jgi:hypothetical protein